MRIQNHKKNRAQYLAVPAPRIELNEHNINNSVCVYCGCQLPREVEFQIYHMQMTRGLVT